MTLYCTTCKGKRHHVKVRDAARNGMAYYRCMLCGRYRYARAKGAGS